MRGTIEAIERELVEGDFVLRYRTVDSGEVDGLTGREGAFLACSFWLADCLTLLGRTHDARTLLDRLLDLRNDLGLLSEEYDPVAGRLVGNFPQAFSHVSLVNSAAKIGGHAKPSADHVFLGLARQAHGRDAVGRAATRHLHGAGRPGARNRGQRGRRRGRTVRSRPTSDVGGAHAGPAGRRVVAARKVGHDQEPAATRPDGDAEGGHGQEGRRPPTKAATKKAAAKKAGRQEGGRRRRPRREEGRRQKARPRRHRPDDGAGRRRRRRPRRRRKAAAADGAGEAR